MGAKADSTGSGVLATLACLASSAGFAGSAGTDCLLLCSLIDKKHVVGRSLHPRCAETLQTWSTTESSKSIQGNNSMASRESANQSPRLGVITDP